MFLYTCTCIVLKASFCVTFSVIFATRASTFVSIQEPVICYVYCLHSWCNFSIFRLIVTPLLVTCSVSSHQMNQRWFIVNSTLRNTFQWNMNETIEIFLPGNAFENVIWKIVAIFFRPQYAQDLTHCGLVMPYADIYWVNGTKPLPSADGNFFTNRFYGIHLRANSREEHELELDNWTTVKSLI